MRRPAGTARAAVLLAVAVAFSRAHAAQDVPFKVIDGKLCARCTLSGPKTAIDANVVIDLGSRVPLLVHARSARLLGMSPGGTGQVKFADFSLDKLRVSAGNLGSLEDLSARFSSELGEVPAVAILGMTAFAGYTPQLEVGGQVLKLLPMEDPTPPGPDAVIVGYEETRSGYLLSGLLGEDRPVRVAFSTAAHDTLIDAALAREAGSPGGAFDVLTLGPLNVARYVALRPEDLSGGAEPRPEVVLGTGLLAHFRVRIDFAGKRMIFEETQPARFPAEERAYFLARAADDAAGIEEFLKKHAASRLADEAGERLLRLRLSESPGDRRRIVEAVRLFAAGVPENRRAAVLVRLTDQLLASGRPDKYDLAREALDTAAKSAGADPNAVADFQLQARRGLIALRLDDLTTARRNLLSAAFGLPRDRLVNLWLGELYERTGKLHRAWSRYIQSALDRDPPREAFAALDRLNRNPEFRKTFTMQDAEQLLEGRIIEYHPPGRYDPAEAGAAEPVRLVELFTCINAPGTAAPELAFGALREFFEGEPVAFVAYHLSSPDADPLTSDAAMTRAAHYKVTTAPAAYFDGRTPDDSEGDERSAARVMATYRRLSMPGGERDRSWRLTGRIALNGDELNGSVVLTRSAVAAGRAASRPASAAADSRPASAPATRPAETDLRLHVVLCERTVMVPGANKLVLHRCVARAMLSPASGHAISSTDRRRTFSIRVRADEIMKAIEKQLAALEVEQGMPFAARPTYVDLGACSVVVILQDAGSGQVLTAGTFDVKPEAQRPS